MKEKRKTKHTAGRVFETCCGERNLGTADYRIGDVVLCRAALIDVEVFPHGAFNAHHCLRVIPVHPLLCPTILSYCGYKMLVTDLRGRLALVTGATGGIGSATCTALALLGCSVAVHYNSAASAAERLVVELRKQNVGAECFQADLSGYENVRLLHKQVTEKMGSPSILFNNAGITVKHGVKDIAEVSIEMFEHTWRANCGSAFLLTQLCLPAMEDVGWGRVIFCSSVAGFTGGVVGPHYA